MSQQPQWGSLPVLGTGEEKGDALSRENPAQTPLPSAHSSSGLFPAFPAVSVTVELSGFISTAGVRVGG